MWSQDVNSRKGDDLPPCRREERNKRFSTRDPPSCHHHCHVLTTVMPPIVPWPVQLGHSTCPPVRWNRWLETKFLFVSVAFLYHADMLLGRVIGSRWHDIKHIMETRELVLEVSVSSHIHARVIGPWIPGSSVISRVPLTTAWREGRLHDNLPWTFLWTWRERLTLSFLFLSINLSFSFCLSLPPCVLVCMCACELSHVFTCLCLSFHYSWILCVCVYI